MYQGDDSLLTIDTYLYSRIEVIEQNLQNTKKFLDRNHFLQERRVVDEGYSKHQGSRRTRRIFHGSRTWYILLSRGRVAIR